MGAPFKIGDRVVAVRNHSMGAFNLGQEFTVLDVKVSCCRWVVYVGIKTDSAIINCTCGGNFSSEFNWWFDFYCFAPLLSTFSRMTFKEVINEVVTCEN